MGNQLTGIAPSEIHPVDYYLTEATGLKFDLKLASTRFLKVARAVSNEGLVVVKVFVIHDQSLPVQEYKLKLEQIQNKLDSAPNCLCFQQFILMEKAALFIREYVKYSVYDRISTRPFLTVIEKKWLAFQVLCALSQCHRQGVCHGDIKLENILVTSWNWVFLADFAPFKPTYLPISNPFDFSYFFDTSHRDICYIAPERFVETSNPADTSQMFLTDTDIKKGDVTPAMDIFSTGCTLIELFMEGKVPFEFSQLLLHIKGEYSPDEVLDKIEDVALREFLSHMIQKDPTKRFSAEKYLDDQRGKVFPIYFYTFLQGFMHIFSNAENVLPPDEKMFLIRAEIHNIVDMYVKPKGDNNSQLKPDAPDILLLITSLVTSCVRSLCHVQSKLNCLEVLREICQHVSAETILDRILSYICHLLRDPAPRVRVMAVHSLTHCLSCVKTIPPSDSNIFPEYIFPTLAVISQDEATVVRAAFAEDIAFLAEISLKFLQLSQIAFSLASERIQTSYEMELCILQGNVVQIVQRMLTDPENLVKNMLMEHSITRLCIFFGRQKANDLLLGHMVTFLNDKQDKDLRSCFYNSIIGVAAYVGWQSSSVLKPLLEQGLTDPEEFVVCKAINAMSALTELGLIPKLSLYDLLTQTVCFLVHPNLWIRQAIVGFVSSMARTLNLVDVQCKVLGLIQPYLAQSIIQIEKEIILLSALKPPIPRVVYDTVLKSGDLPLVIETLEDQRRARIMTRAGQLTSQGEIPSAIRNLFRRLSAEGLNEQGEEYLLSMKDILLKTYAHRAQAMLQKEVAAEGWMDLGVLRSTSAVRSIELSIQDRRDSDLIDRKHQRNQKTTVRIPTTSMNEEWQHMFAGSSTEQSSTPTDISINNSSSIEAERCATPLQKTIGGIPPEKAVQCRVAPCKRDLQSLLNKKIEASTSVMLSGSMMHDHFVPQVCFTQPDSTRPRGILVAHLHEHKATVTRICAMPDSHLFASASLDGSVRIWDCAKMEGRNIANRSKSVYSRLGGPVSCLAVCSSTQNVAASSENGLIHVFRVDGTGTKSSYLSSRQLDLTEEGAAVDMHYLDNGSQSVLVYATTFGSLVGWDLRDNFYGWKLETGFKYGLVSCLCADPHQNWLAVGTTNGFIVVFDLRFHLPISVLRHPRHCRIRRVSIHPVCPMWIIASAQGNNEIGIWNMETQSRELTLCSANSASPLKNQQTQHVSPHSQCALTVGMTGQGHPFLLSGGTDMRLRYWNLKAPKQSVMLVPAAMEHYPPNQVDCKFDYTTVDGIQVVTETLSKFRRVPVPDESPRNNPEQPAPGHHDCISDITICHASQPFIITASRDGVIKAWK